MMKCLIAYVTYSGNTEEIADLIEAELVKRQIEVDSFDVSYDQLDLDIEQYNLVFLGTFTWDYGSLPEEMVAFLTEVQLETNEVAVFGSGDTQFGGEDIYCKAVETLSAKYESNWQGLKVEQSPRGSQEELVSKWLERVLADVKITI